MASRSPGAVVPSVEVLLRKAFDAYNHRDSPTLLTLVADDVLWPGDAGPLRGKNELRAFWKQQWAATRTHDQVLAVEQQPDGILAVTLDQVVRSMDGRVLSAGRFTYDFVVENGRIAQLRTRQRHEA